MYVEWHRLQRTGLRRLQEAGVPLFQATRLFRVYCSNVIPGLVQTPEYAAALLSAIADFRGTPADAPEAAAARVERSRVLYEGNHRFALLVEESTLRYRIGDSDVMAGQLRHLLAVMVLPSVSLGVIPFTAQRRMWPLEAFRIFDEQRVHVELLSAAVRITQPSEVALYMKGFAELAEHAVYGEQVRRLITAAIDALD